MRANRVMGALSIVLGLGVAAASVLGPLWLDVIRQHISTNMENQVIGADLVSLALVAPLAVVAGVLWWRGHRLGPIVALGPAGYAVYVFFQYITGAEYLLYEGNSERAFPLFYLITLFGLIIALTAWSQIDAATLPEPSARVRRTTAGVLLTLGGFLGLAWVKWVYDIVQGARPVDYVEHPALSWLVKTMDLTLVMPATIATGIALLLHKRSGIKAAYALTTAATLLAASVGSMALVMTLRDDPSSQPIFAVVMYLGAAGLGTLTISLWRSALRGAHDALVETPPAGIRRWHSRHPGTA
jgi:hypothetical protein